VAPLSLVAWSWLLACSPGDQAPEDLDGLLHFLWSSYDDGTDAELIDALDNLDVAIDGGVEPLSGTVSLLDDQERAEAGHVADVENEAGLHVVDPFDCSMAMLEAIVSYPDQDALKDILDEYERRFDGDRQAFLDGETDVLSWDVTYKASTLFASQYTAELRGGMRRVSATGLGQSAFGDFVLSRTALVEPATFEDDDGVFDQDRRVELWYLADSGQMIHVEALWRHMEAGVVNTGSDAIQDLIIDGLQDWAADTEQWCADGLP